MNQHFSPPGTITYTGKKNSDPITVHYMEFQEGEVIELKYTEDNIVYHENKMDNLQWYDVCGLHNVEVIRKIGENFGMHPLVTEDIVDVNQRPNYTEFQHGNFLSLKHIFVNNQRIKKEAVSIFFGEGFVLTFQEYGEDLFQNLRHRILQRKGRIHIRQADYLAYAITDFIVDHYFSLIELFNDQAEALEDIINESDSIDKSDIYAVKKDLTSLRKGIAPLREAINNFARSDSSLIEEKTTFFLRDLHDHVIQILDNIDIQREILSSLQDLYLSEISMRMNRIMQFLTITTAIFVPLSFLTGLYGMNFENIPELHYKYGYFALWGAMILITLGMIFYFKKKKWF